MADRLTVPIPRRMRGLRVDKRGYPEPWNLMVDKTGKAHFTINDTARTLQAKAECLCSMCGQPHDADGMWFIGGPLSALHPHGAYIDPPVHHQCGTYALRVCPYLAAPNWNNRTIGMKVAQGIAPEDLPEHVGAFRDVSMPSLNKRPPMFMFVKAHSYSLGWDENRYFRPTRPYLDLEFWRDGEQLDPAEAQRVIEEELPGWYDRG